MFGFLDGPHGLFTGNYIELDDERVYKFRQMGGFDIIGSGRHKIESKEQFEGAAKTCTDLRLDGVAVIGGDDSNTNAAMVAEYFKANGVPTNVVGVPKTIDGDLKNSHIPVSFGFDTACKTYSEMVGNLCHDCLSSRKYYHVIRAMGRAASNIALEVALQTQPNVCLISEEVAARRQNLASITKEVADVIVRRAKAGKDYGIIILPEGLVEFVPEMGALLSEINDLMAAGTPASLAAVQAALSANNAALFAFLPDSIKAQLLADRDPHGNVQVSKIETEKLLCELVAKELERLRAKGDYAGTFAPQYHFFGYEARCALPSEFDTAYCYALGMNAGSILHFGFTGLISCVSNLGAAVEEWVCSGTPLTAMMCLERRKGEMKPVIRKALVELTGLPFRTLAAHRERWAWGDCYRCPGPIQFATDEETAATSGAAEASASASSGTRVDPISMTLALEIEEAREGLATAGKRGSAKTREHYAGYLEGMLSDGCMSAGEAEASLMWRLGHGISDEDHAWALDQVGWTVERFAEAERSAKASAAPAHPGLIAEAAGLIKPADEIAATA